MTLVLLIYAVCSTQFFYAKGLEEKQESLKVQIGVFDENVYPLTNAGAKDYSARVFGRRVTFIGLDGEVLGDSHSTQTGNHADREEVQEALEVGYATAIRQSSIGKEMIYACQKISLQDGSEVLVRISQEAPSAWAYFADQLPALAWFLVLDVFVCLLFVYLQTRFVLRPVEKVAFDAARNVRVDTKYAELRPVVDLLNKRNEEVGEKFKQLQEEKERAERMQRSKDEFIANITHEMNTPLTSIKGYAELLSTGMLSAEEAKDAAAILQTQSGRLANLIKCIIDYNRIDDDTLPLYEVNVSSVTEEIVRSLAPSTAKRNLIVESEIDAGVTLVSRQERVQEVVGNLIRNAIRYNRDGGTLVVLLKKTGTGARLTVRDTGVGIAEENLDRIFDRFFTVDKSHGGTHGGFGLGLAVVKKICYISKWTIGVQSTLGEGTTFTVDFPL